MKQGSLTFAFSPKYNIFISISTGVYSALPFALFCRESMLNIIGSYKIFKKKGGLIITHYYKIKLFHTYIDKATDLRKIHILEKILISKSRAF